MRISDWSSDVCSSDLAIVDQPARPPDLRHHAVAGVVAQRAGDTSDLRSFADVDAGRADRDALVAIDAVAEGVGILLGLLDAAARLAAPALVGHEKRFFVHHRGLDARPGTHIDAHLLAQETAKNKGRRGDRKSTRLNSRH